LAVQFAIEGDLRFISHHDSLRLFERALARAGLPVRFSEGFNPRPKLRLALPRPVGVASQDELLVVELVRDSEPDDARTALAAQVPVGITLRSVGRLADGDRRHPRAATYELAVDPGRAEGLAGRVVEFMASGNVVVQRPSPRGPGIKSVDIRSFVMSMSVVGDRLQWTQSIGQDGTARVNELLDALELPSRDYLHRVVRRAVEYGP
jgi:radical SAM-linked protein